MGTMSTMPAPGSSSTDNVEPRAPSSNSDAAETTSIVSFDLPAPSEEITLSSLASHSEKAALEDEWEKQGIGFQTRAEQIYKLQNSQSAGPSSGSELLESLIKQNLMWDQYDRVLGEQDTELQRRIESMKAKRQDKGNEKDKSV